MNYSAEDNEPYLTLNMRLLSSAYGITTVSDTTKAKLWLNKNFRITTCITK